MSCIFVDGDIYLGANKGNYVPVKDKNKAKVFDSTEKAYSQFYSSVPKVLRNDYNWEIELIEHVENVKSSEKINSTYTSIDIEELKESINSLSEKFSLLKGNKEWLLEKESNVDKQISDILHFIEFSSFSACEGYKLCKAIKELRLKRREIKNELEIINIINCHTCNNIANGNTNKSIDGIENKKYTPRVLNELFENRKINDLIKTD